MASTTPAIPITETSTPAKKIFSEADGRVHKLLIGLLRDGLHSAESKERFLEGSRNQITATQSSILAMQPEEGKQDIYDEALADINRLVEEVEALSRKRSRSVTSPTSKPAKHRRFREVPGDAGAGSIEERMEIDEHNDTAMNVDEAQAPEDHMDIWSEDAFAQLAGVLGVTEETEETEEIEEIEETGETEETEEIEEAEETEEVLNLPVLRDSVYTCVEAVGARRSGMRRILSLAYLIALEDDVQFASGLYRSGSRPHHGE